MTYTTRADLLIAAGESIKMQEAAGIEPMCKYAGCIHCIEDLKLIISSCEYEFPLFVLEGKPVFKDDEIWYNGYDSPRAARKVKIVRVLDNREYKYVAEDGGIFSIDGLSWNQPKPKKVTVEIPYEDAKLFAQGHCVRSQTIQKIFQDALKGIEQ